MRTRPSIYEQFKSLVYGKNVMWRVSAMCWTGAAWWRSGFRRLSRFGGPGRRDNCLGAISLCLLRCYIAFTTRVGYTKNVPPPRNILIWLGRSKLRCLKGGFWGTNLVWYLCNVVPSYPHRTILACVSPVARAHLVLSSDHLVRNHVHHRW